MHVNDYLTKPYTKERLMDTLDRVIEKRRQRLYIPVPCGNEIRRIDLYSVAYVEARNHSLEIHLKIGKLPKARMTLTEHQRTVSGGQRLCGSRRFVYCQSALCAESTFGCTGNGRRRDDSCPKAAAQRSETAIFRFLYKGGDQAMTGSDMIHLAAAMVILVLTHIFCLAAMTERKYSIPKTALIYAAFGVFFIGLTLVVFALFGSGSAITAFVSFTSTALMAFFMFIVTSVDAFCKKLFLFISHSNLFCIFFCIAILVCNALFPELSETGTLYARNLVRTLLYLLAVLGYLKFLRPYVRMVPGTKKRTWYSISLVSMLFLAVFISFVIFLYAGYGHENETIFLF